MIDKLSLERKSSLNKYWLELKPKLSNFAIRAVNFAEQSGLHVDDLEIDHMGMRFKSQKDAEYLRQALEGKATLISDAIVNGRRITNHKFNFENSIWFGDRSISCIEIPDPTHNHDFPEDGPEHVEFVIDCQATNIQEMHEAFSERYPGFKGDMRIVMPSVEGEQLANPTVIIENPTNRMCNIKFHPHSIIDIVNSGKDKFRLGY